MIKTFLKYINGQKEDNNFINMINNRICKIKENKEWRQEYMTLLMREREIAEENFEQGMQKGKQEGLEEGMQKGKQEGMQKERENRMLKQIMLLKELNIDENVIIEKIVRDYEVSEEEVKKYL